MSQTIEFWMKQTEIRESALKIAESKIAELETQLEDKKLFELLDKKQIKKLETQLDAVRTITTKTHALQMKQAARNAIVAALNGEEI